jgi:tetratricopeptide (TPR) repeat protein
MHALRIDPKCAAAYKSRFKIYSKLAMMAAQDEEEGLDDEEEEDEDEDESKPDSKTLLMKSAYDALAAFILDGSTNILLAGAAEDATREACRAEAKEYFWDRNGDDSDDDSDWSDDDSEEGSAASNDEDGDVKEKDDEEDDIPQIGGSITKLRSCIGTAEELDANRVLFDSILESSTLPRSWLVNSYMTLFAPLNIAFDLTSEMVANQVNHVDDGLDEEGKTIPFMHLLDISNVDDEATSDESAPCELKEGDMDSFKLLCTVVGLLMKCKSACPDTSAIDKSKHVDPVTPSTSDVTVFPENDGNKVSLAFVKATGKDVENNDDSRCIDDSEVKVEVWSVDSLLDMTTEVFGCQGTDIFESGRFSSDLSESKVTSRGVDDEADDDDYVKLSMKDLVLNDCDFPGVAAQKDSQAGTCNASVNFQEAFSLICSGEASALTGVEFKWCKKGDTDNACYRLHVEVMDSVMSGKAEEGKDVVEGDDVTTSRDVSPKLRSRLLSLCGSIAYLCGDAMGGYKCLKASILLDDNLLDSRLKISSILLEMDELDKAEAQLMEASHRPKWEEDICLNLHLAELHLHRMEYFPAVRILRSTSRRLDFLLEGWEGLVDEKEVARHIGPTIVSLHGVAEFRVNPETPLRALNILQKGIKTFPDNVSLCVCYGEVLGQAGDPAGALKSYSDASAMEPNHPLPFLNASRVYQQLNQMQLCKKHMEKAFNLDKSLSLTLVDIAQFKLHEKRFSDQGEAAVSSPSSEEEGMFFEDLSSEEILETAVDVSRHVSEVIDVFTAKQIARFYAKLGASGLAPIFL